MEKIICECCEREIDSNYEELQPRKNWRGITYLCCNECCEEFDRDQDDFDEPDDYDIMIDKMLEEGE